MAERYVEFSFPIWAVVDTEYAKEHGESFAVHTLTSEDGDVDLPLYTSEEKVRAYIAARGLAGHDVTRFDGDTDLRIILEVFRNRSGRYVRIDDPTGSAPGVFCPTLDAFLSILRT
jgi:hypothetical protein